MIACFRLYRVLPLLAAGAIVWSSPATAQTPREPVAQMRASLAQQQLWGRDYPLLIASIPAWVRIQEKTIVVAPDVVFGGTPFSTIEEAEKHAQDLRRALAEVPKPLSPDFASIAEQAKGRVAERVGVHRYGGDNSYRVIIGFGLNLLPPDLHAVEVERLLGKEEAVKRDVEDGGGEHRPVVFTTHVWAGGALLYQTSNYAPTPDQIVRVILNVPVALRALAEKP
jgi:hypothetical protein